MRRIGLGHLGPLSWSAAVHGLERRLDVRWRASAGPHSRGRRGLSIWLSWARATRDLLFSLQSRCSRLDQGILYGPYDVWGKDRSVIHGPRNGFLPGFEHLVHLAAHVRVDRCVRVHEGLIQLPPKEEGIRCPDIFNDRVENVESWELFVRRCLIHGLATGGQSS
jgi:hypothetical protein